jgi:hypothetical protein
MDFISADIGVYRVCRGADGVSNVDMDGNNALQIKATRVVISTFETLPLHHEFLQFYLH